MPGYADDPVRLMAAKVFRLDDASAQFLDARSKRGLRDSRIESDARPTQTLPSLNPGRPGRTLVPRSAEHPVRTRGTEPRRFDDASAQFLDACPEGGFRGRGVLSATRQAYAPTFLDAVRVWRALVPSGAHSPMRAAATQPRRFNDTPA